MKDLIWLVAIIFLGIYLLKGRVYGQCPKCGDRKKNDLKVVTRYGFAGSAAPYVACRDCGTHLWPNGDRRV